MKKIVIKASKPFLEVTPKVEGVSNPITLGVKLYGKSDRKALQERYTVASDSTGIEKAQAELKEFEESGDKTSDDFYVMRKELQANLEKLSETYLEKLASFYKEQVLFIRKASITIADDETGMESTLAIIDTRTVDPIESLWATPEECLDVLLDYYFDDDSYKDSLIQHISATIFNIKLKAEGKTKNS